MDYCKINEQSQPQKMANPFRATISNPNEHQKEQLADVFGYLPMQYTETPSYDPETQYVTDYWMEEDGYAVQHWEVHEIEPVPVEEPS